MRLVVLAGIIAMTACAASADQAKDGSVQVTPGRYSWKQETNIVGIGLKEDNIECLIPEKATITRPNRSNPARSSARSPIAARP